MKILLSIKLFILSIILITNFTTKAISKTSVQSCNRTVTFDTPPKRAISNDVNLTEMMLASQSFYHLDP